MASAKGHMNSTRKGIRSTSKMNKADKDPKDFNPQKDETAEVELFLGTTIALQNNGTIYTDQTGNFPVRSFHDKNACL